MRTVTIPTPNPKQRLFLLDITSVWPECPDKGDISDMAQYCR